MTFHHQQKHLWMCTGTEMNEMEKQKERKKGRREIIEKKSKTLIFLFHTMYKKKTAMYYYEKVPIYSLDSSPSYLEINKFKPGTLTERTNKKKNWNKTKNENPPSNPYKVKINEIKNMHMFFPLLNKKLKKRIPFT